MGVEAVVAGYSRKKLNYDLPRFYTSKLSFDRIWELCKALWEVGSEVKVTAVEVESFPSATDVVVEGEFYNGQNKKVGDWGCTLSFFGGKIRVSQDRLFITKGNQKTGLGKRWVQSFLPLYKKLGVVENTVYAGSTTGGYFWASCGYEPEWKYSAFPEVLLGLSQGKYHHLLPKTTIKKYKKWWSAESLQKEAGLLYAEYINTGKIPLQTFIKFGDTQFYDNEHKMWPGKALTLGTCWAGSIQPRKLKV